MSRSADVCDKCGERIPVPGWPYCKSERNPGGHERGTYTFKLGYDMKGFGWGRSKV